MGNVVPEQMDAESALTLMVREPLLIRRPLIQGGDRREVGFDTKLIDTWIGLQSVDDTHQAISQNLMSQDLQNCPRRHEENFWRFPTLPFREREFLRGNG